MSIHRRQETEDRRKKSGVGSHETEGLLVRGSYCLLVATVSLVFSAGCRMDMQDQPKLEVYEKDSIRKPVEGTVPRGHLREDKHLYTGKKDKANPTMSQGPASQIQSTIQPPGGTVVPAIAMYPDAVETFPFPITDKIVERGEVRYNIFCGMCHGPTGYGDGMIVRRGFRRPPSYHTEQLRQAPVGHFYDVVTNGWGSMPSYASMIPVADRWAIIAYIRALQLSQNPQGTTVTNAKAAETQSVPQQRPETRGRR